MSSSIRIGISSGSAALERCLDIPGYIPFLGSASAVIRFRLAAIQSAICLAAAAILLFGTLYNKVAGRKIGAETLSQWRQIFQDNGQNLLSNCLRSFVEMIPFLNLSLILYDIAKVKAYRSLDKYNKFLADLPEVYPDELNIPLLPHIMATERRAPSAAVNSYL